ncbi:alpha-hydroxy-acid oxidizing protein [Fluoribacter dumoffii]|uniref:(S)-mandelate dehydrogenase n=1 Tax=Fluoribacter dumoffii TaxID=463 RepID=A0A377GCL5_9GAMM|nr:alpha-hydroxy acid oxidase [Fluoribacter dumoffii]KTC90678.1 FMN-dependent dehydrogenase [Fluoribacter dumoffii NY 23]MCW8419411.1 alpha-hydroxy-acid oxidizing protein [Fluoribacter dumoffii]MCW8452714.1 alpha-hydroxy-acid oxidizing protein [Fluoribacter dumoffii]MCW8460036.1 alpha-hydroxy-acid oxidizing protein [Fluoribacter dumoffii]MCW8483514.1 alpha-hydroxy-acid oxidizing protein [Fluoribacter dumoffii]
MRIPATVSDYRLLAKRKLSKKIFDFIDAGAGDEITKRNNRDAFDNISLRPLCLKDVSCIVTATCLLGLEQTFPLLIAPTAFHQLLDEEGEVSTAKAAGFCGIPMVVSSMSNRSLEDIAHFSSNENLWLQVYIFKNRELTASLIHRAEKSGYKAILITVGVPITGKRDRNIRNPFVLPPELSTGNFTSTANSEVLHQFTAHEFDPSLTWKDIEWVQSLTALPIILKGILNPLDAEKACSLNVAGIVVSNHGGRQLDTAMSTITALSDVVRTVAGRTMILLDGGIERGTDMFKALALGADAVLAGRSILWALAVNGREGVQSMLALLREELETTMMLTGCRDIQEIKQLGNDICCMGMKTFYEN